MSDDLLDRYPKTPGHKTGGTSKDAAVAMKGRAPTLRDRVLSLFDSGMEWTPDEAAAKLRKTVLSIRPRFSELVFRQEIEPTGKRRANASGLKANVYRRIVF